VISKKSPICAVAGTVMICVVAVGNPEVSVGSVEGPSTVPLKGKARGTPAISTAPFTDSEVP
jgi:hypothetical protein